MLASAATASARAGPASTAALTGYRSSLRASSSALIAEISASTASISLAPPQVVAHRPGQGRRHVPRPAPAGRARGEVGIRAVRLPVRAPAAGPAAPARLLGQRPGQHLLHVAEPGRQLRGAGPAAAASDRPPEIVLVLHSSHKSMPLISHHDQRPCDATDQRVEFGQPLGRQPARPAAARPGRSTPAAA